MCVNKQSLVLTFKNDCDGFGLKTKKWMVTISSVVQGIVGNISWINMHKCENTSDTPPRHKGIFDTVLTEALYTVWLKK